MDDLQELNVMLAERLEEWAHAYKAEGIAEGKAAARSKGKRKGKAEGQS
jgi:flagellar biosynthesis/type III secretory pathway protein FliH